MTDTKQKPDGYSRDNVAIGDSVLMFCNWAEDELWFEVLEYSSDGESDGFVYFHPLTGKLAAWYFSSVSDCKPGVRGQVGKYKSDHEPVFLDEEEK